MRVTIHQPEHLVWLGLLDKVARADSFVILDSVQFRKQYFQNRNRIRTERRWEWLTVPVRRHSLATSIRDISITQERDWKPAYLNRVRSAYCSAPGYECYYPHLAKIITAARESLCELNLALLNFVLSEMRIRTPCVRASELDLDPSLRGSDLILEICRNRGAEHYLSGPHGRDYLDADAFANAGVSIEYHEFMHPRYRQLHEPFIPGMSSIDLLFNHGDDAAGILAGSATRCETPPAGE